MNNDEHHHKDVTLGDPLETGLTYAMPAKYPAEACQTEKEK